MSWNRAQKSLNYTASVLIVPGCLDKINTPALCGSPACPCRKHARFTRWPPSACRRVMWLVVKWTVLPVVFQMTWFYIASCQSSLDRVVKVSWLITDLLSLVKSSLTATGLLYKCLSFTTVGAPTDGVGVPSPQHRQEGTMTTYPARGVVFITLSCLGWGEGTPTPSVGSCFLALSVVLININSCS